MPYEPIPGGRKWNEDCADALSKLRHQRRLINDIITTGPTQAQLYQHLVAITLINGEIAETIQKLQDYKP